MAKQNRKKKTDSRPADVGTPVSPDVTPMPSPDQQSPCAPLQKDLQKSSCSILDSNRSLTDMLASENIDINQSKCTESHDDFVLRLEARIVAADIEIQGLRDERIALNNQVELLMLEIDSFKKTDKVQKNEIKKLTNDNDKLRRENSKYNGMRRYTEPVQHPSVSTESTPVHVSDHSKCMKYDELRSKLISITDSLLGALADDHAADDFQTVRHKGRASPRRGQATSLSHEEHRRRDATPVADGPPASQASGVTSFPKPTTRPRPAAAPLPIPVVEIGAAARNASANQRQETSSRPVGEPTTTRSREPETIIIGTSLVRGLGPKLHALGVNATCFSYAGADIPTIQSRISSILPTGTNPNRVILQVAGNDAAKQPTGRIVARYEALVRDVRKRCPQAEIILSKIPPRKGSGKMMATINEVNSHLDKFSVQFTKVSAIDVCPTSLYHFKRDCTHFNMHGLNHYANNLTNYLTNFPSVLLMPIM